MKAITRHKGRMTVTPRLAVGGGGGGTNKALSHLLFLHRRSKTIIYVIRITCMYIPLLMGCNGFL